MLTAVAQKVENYLARLELPDFFRGTTSIFQILRDFDDACFFKS